MRDPFYCSHLTHTHTQDDQSYCHPQVYLIRKNIAKFEGLRPLGLVCKDSFLNGKYGKSLLCHIFIRLMTYNEKSIWILLLDLACGRRYVSFPAVFQENIRHFGNFNPIFFIFVVVEDVTRALASIAILLSKMGSFIFISHQDLGL